MQGNLVQRVRVVVAIVVLVIGVLVQQQRVLELHVLLEPIIQLQANQVLPHASLVVLGHGPQVLLQVVRHASQERNHPQREQQVRQLVHLVL